MNKKYPLTDFFLVKAVKSEWEDKKGICGDFVKDNYI
jgi:hypothetical protein